MLVENDVRMGGLFSGNKELSKSYREGTALKLKSMALPYKTKGPEKKKYRGWSYSNREGTAQKLKSMALPYKTKVRKKNDQNFDFWVFLIS